MFSLIIMQSFNHNHHHYRYTAYAQTDSHQICSVIITLHFAYSFVLHFIIIITIQFIHSTPRPNGKRFSRIIITLHLVQFPKYNRMSSCPSFCKWVLKNNSSYFCPFFLIFTGMVIWVEHTKEVVSFRHNIVSYFELF